MGAGFFRRDCDREMLGKISGSWDVGGGLGWQGAYGQEMKEV